MDFGHIAPTLESAGRIHKRFGLGDVGKDIIDGLGSVFGKYDPGKPVGFDLALGDRRRPTNVFNFE